MLKRLIGILAFALFALPVSSAWADPCSDTANLFRKAGQSGQFFKTAYGYAVFPTIGKGGVGIGGAYGKGCVYAKGKHVGDTSMTQLSIGFQLGGQAYSEIVFFQTAQALENFKLGHLKFDAQASAVALTARASADLAYRNGVAIVTMAKGGLMYEASVGGQKFSYTPVGK